MHAPPLHAHVYFIGRHTGDNAIIQTMGRCRQLGLRNSCQYNNDKYIGLVDGMEARLCEREGRECREDIKQLWVSIVKGT